MDDLRIGVTSPIVTLNPKGHGPWERTAGPSELAAVAEAVDRLGYDHLTCSEHIAVPTEAAATRGGTYWDPLATLSWIASRTTQIKLATYVLVLGYHHPLEIVKSYSTLDVLSGGRVILGVGVGSLEEEFELLGRPFAGRGTAADLAIDEIRGAWGHHEVDGFVVSPAAPRDEVPIWVGGRTRRSLHRAAVRADGWAPFGLSDAELSAALAAVDLPDDFDVVLWAYGIDPIGDPNAVTDRLGELTALGATVVNVRFRAESVNQWIEQAEALAALAGLAATHPT
jgi:probable F420-dependent oxidoreductase